MSEPQSETANTRAKQHEPDDSEPTPERQAELRAAYDANMVSGSPPYSGVTIISKGELQWILRERNWSGGFPMIFVMRDREVVENDLDPKPKPIDLRGASLRNLELKGFEFLYADLSGAQLTNTNLAGARLYRAKLVKAILRRADLQHAELDEANMVDADAEHANFSSASFDSAFLHAANLSGSNLSKARLTLVKAEHARFDSANLRGAELVASRFTEAVFNQADLTSAVATAHFRGANLSKATLVGTVLDGSDLCGAVLSRAQMDSATSLDGTIFDNATQVEDVSWNGAPIEQIDWSKVDRLGDEATMADANTSVEQAHAYQRVARTYKQVATAMRVRSLASLADDFAYRAQTLTRKALWLELFAKHPERWLINQHWYITARRFRRVPRPLFMPLLVVTDWLRRLRRYAASCMLWAIAGYGYRPFRSVLTYLVCVGGYAVLYFCMRESVHPSLNFVDALIFSITSFHGRGFMPGENVNLHNPLTIAAASEAIIGLLIEITFIATFTQRLFAR